MKKPYYGWTIVGVAFLIGATEAGAFQNILSVFLKPMAGEFGWSRAAVSGAMAFGSICAGALSPFVGPVLDRHGPRMIAFWGVLVLSAGLICITFVTHIWQLYLFFGVGRMVAVGALSLVISVTVPNWFIRRRGRAMGITWLGPRFGSAILPALTQFFILTHGWRMAWTALGVVVFLLSGLPSLLFLKRRPEDLGLLPDGDPSRAESDRREGSDPAKTAAPGTAPFEPVWTRAQALRTSTFWMLTFICSLAPFTQAGINFHIFPYLTDQGVSEARAVLILSTIAIFGAVGALLWGVLAEKIETKKLLAANAIASGLVFFLLFLAVSIKLAGFGILFFLAAVHGILHGGRLPLLSIIWANLFGRTALGSIYGFSSPFRFTANAISPIFAALFFDLFGSYTIPFCLFTVGFLIMGVFSLRLKPPLHPAPSKS